MSSRRPIVRARAFEYAYPEREDPALAALDLDVEEGEFVVLAGESGSGKSTLVRALCGLVPHFHGGSAGGELAVAGMSVRDHGPAELSDVCGTVFQDPEAQVVMTGVRAEIALRLEHRGDAPAAVARAVEETALALGVAGLLDRSADTLSGGELQRVALASALVHRPRLLLLDEPTSQLDPVAGDELVSLLRRLNEEWGTTIVLAEHRLERCIAAVDRVVALDGGRVVADEAPREFLAWAARERAALATPGARMFAAAGISPPPVSVKDARATLSSAGWSRPNDERRAVRSARRKHTEAALSMSGVWHELRDGPPILRGVDLRVAPGERIALMGRNGAGKSTLLKHARGLMEPTRGAIERGGEIALLLQNPNDYLLHEHADEEVGQEALARAGLAGRGRSNPRDLSGGERQRLALEIVLDGDAPAAVCLDEPTRGMDRPRKDALALAARRHRGRRLGGHRRHARHRVRGRPRRSRRPDGGGRSDRRRHARRGARRRLALRDRGRADPRRCGWRAHPRPGRGGADGEERSRNAGRGAGRMSWQLAAFAILGLALALGFAWYERSKPQARVLALVAALAALAVVGRIAFAPFPNVKPTTDIVFFAGYALGGLPGFATGAVAALVSNIFFGQGPWTPWQMAAWGGVGAAGGAIALLTRGRELSRWTLAAICFVAGLAFGAVMDVYQWTLAAEQSLATYLAIAGTSLPYNLAHAIGNAVFCALIGPAFVRALGRYRRRFEVSWPKPAAGSAAAAVVLAVVLVAGAGSALDPPSARAASSTDAAAAYLERAQNSDGGFGGARGQGSTQLFTGWSALGLAANGRNPRDVRRSGKNVIEYVRARAGSLDDIGELERTILVLGASGLSPRSFAGRDLVAELKRRAGGEGSYGSKTPLAAFAVMALRAAGEPASSGAVRTPARWMAAQQNDDGGFGAGRRGGSSDVDDTGAVLQALAAANRDGGEVEARAIAFLKRAQNVNGGFPQSAGGESNAQSTAWAVQGLTAAGRSPSSFRRSGGRDPAAYLRSLQQDDGSVRYSRTSAQTPVWVTAQALTALAGRPFPLARVKRRGGGGGNRGSATDGDQEGQAAGGGGGKPGESSVSGNDSTAAGTAGKLPATGLTALASNTQRPAATAALGSDNGVRIWLLVPALLLLGGAFYAARRAAPWFNRGADG